MTEIKYCSEKGCKKLACWMPIIMAPAPWPSIAEAKLTPELPICDEHKKNVALGDFITDDSWPIIKDIFNATGKVEPDRNRLRLEFEKIKTIQS